MTKNQRTVRALPIAMMVLSSVLGATLVLGQGGTGRENANTNSNKKAPAPKRTTTPRKPAKTTRSTAPAKSNKSTDESGADERTYWESIKDSSDPEDFKAYLKQYPNGKFATLANNRLKNLEAAKSKPSATPNPATETPANRTSTNSSLSNLPRTRTNQAGIEFVLLPPGSFMMGSTNGDVYEKPAHQVTINYSFYMGKYEVTQAQWQAVMGSNPSYFKDCGGNCPVEQVSWDDAQEFIRKVNQMNDGYTYRLPTEAEWEYACRAGTTGDYAGNLSEMAWYSENSGSKTHAVGGKQPNAWGLADMHGNVWEWCQDWYHETYYGAPTDGSAWLIGGDQKYRVLRGGS